MKLPFLWERWHPQVLTIIAAIVYREVCLRQGLPLYVPEKAQDLLGAGINVGGMAIAFIVTVEGLLLAMQDNPVVRRVRELQIYEPLLKYFSSAARWSFFLVTVSIAGLYVPFDPTNIPEWQRWAFLAWSGVGMVTALTCYRITSLFIAILHK